MYCYINTPGNGKNEKLFEKTLPCRHRVSTVLYFLNFMPPARNPGTGNATRKVTSSRITNSSFLIHNLNLRYNM